MTKLSDYFSRHVDDGEVVIELTQRTVADLVSKGVIQRFLTTDEVMGHVYGFAVKQLDRHWTEHKRSRRHEELLADHEAELALVENPSLEKDYKDGELRVLLDELLKRLPQALRVVWDLRAEDLSFLQIGECIDVSESTAQRRFDAAKRRLRREYQRARRTRTEYRSPPKTGS